MYDFKGVNTTAAITRGESLEFTVNNGKSRTIYSFTIADTDMDLSRFGAFMGGTTDANFTLNSSGILIKGRILSILNLKNGDKVTVNYKLASEGSLTLADATLIGNTTDNSFESGTEYTISTEEESVHLDIIASANNNYVEKISITPYVEPVPDPTPTEAVNVFLTAGQSNTAGRCMNENLPEYIKALGNANSGAYQYCNWSYTNGSTRKSESEGVFRKFWPEMESTSNNGRFAYDAIVYYWIEQALQKDLFSMSEIRSDNVWARVDVKQNDYVDVCTFNANGLLTDDIVKGCWSDYFKVVAAANVFIEKMQDTDVLTASQKEQYMAEARFLRAYAYFDLVRFFGRVPAPTRQLTTDEAFQLHQSEPSDVYNNVIVPDLQYAISHLAVTAFDHQNKEHGERVSLIAAKALLGKVYLTMAGFPIKDTAKKSLAVTLLKQVIDEADATGRYWAPTQHEWTHMWIHENDNKYALFEIQYIARLNQGNPMVTLTLSTPSADWCGNKLITGAHLYVEKGLREYYIQKDAVGNYADQRASGTINLRTTVDEDGNESSPTGNTFFVKFFENKYKRADLGYADMDAEIVDRTYWPQNYPLLRLEDVMLLYAECVGATTEGYDMVNRIRQRAGLSALSGLTEAQFQDAVANERRYELAEEGHRWFDLVRQEKYVETLQAMFAYNDDTTTGTYKAFASRVTKDMYLYPIPQSQIEVRAGLYSQNPGY